MDLDFNAIISRVIRVFTFDLTVFQEVEEDQMATQQAWAVVVIAAVASGIGAALGGLIGPGGSFVGFIVGLILSPILALIGYFLWAFVTYWVGVNLFQAETDFAEMQRVIGFAYAPNVVGIISFIPCIGPLISLAGSLYALVLTVMAVKEGLDVEWPQAIITCVIGWIVNMILVAGIMALIMGVVVGTAVIAGS